MNDSDRKVFFRSWAAAWEQCGRTVTDTQLRFAFKALEDLPLAEVQRGILQHSRDPDAGQFPPKPADIIRQIEGGTSGNATEAWGKVMLAIERHGPYARLVFDDPAIHAALQSVGWMGLMTASYDKLNFKQRDFEAAYKAARGTKHYPAVICGIPTPGTEPKPIVTIGDEDRARRVHMLGHDPAGRDTEALSAAEIAGRLVLQ